MDRDGVAILYRKAGTAGVPIYDRYVANGSFCQGGEDTIKESVPTADTTKLPRQQVHGREPLRRRQQPVALHGI